jgi:hypothetical protein
VLDRRGGNIAHQPLSLPLQIYKQHMKHLFVVHQLNCGKGDLQESGIAFTAINHHYSKYMMKIIVSHTYMGRW